MVYGYCRISTNKQNIERQVRNILEQFPEAHIVKDIYTGTQFQGRKELEKILKHIKSGDTLVFDSVSRMSRDSDEGFQLYEELFHKGVNLVFLKEQFINTETYKKAIQNQINLTNSSVDLILKGINEYLLLLAKEQIKLTFQQAEKEVSDLHKRTSEGIKTAKLNGKQIGQKPGAKLNVRKAAVAKEQISKYNKHFGGSLNNEETWRLVGISKMSFYKYLKELQNEYTALV